jgi:hypothetical protein
MLPRTRRYILAGVLLFLLITILTTVTLLKTGSHESTSDIYSLIQVITGILSVLLAIVPIGLDLYDRHKARNSRPDNDTGKYLLGDIELNSAYNGGIVDNAKAHVRYLCDTLQKRRNCAFAFNTHSDVQLNYVPADLVRLTYNDDVQSVGVVSRWKEYGDHFDSAQLMKIITAKHSEPLNLLIEVGTY